MKAGVLKICRGRYASLSRAIWNHLPPFLSRISGRELHAIIRRHSGRRQSFGTFFLRNRAELELMCRLLDEKGAGGSSTDIAVLACSKGAEVYSILWTIRSRLPDLKVTWRAVDISQEILDFAQKGVYLRSDLDILSVPNRQGMPASDLTRNTWRDQTASIFERMTPEEMEAMFDLEGDQAKIRPWLKEGIIWVCGNAGDPEMVNVLGPQDIVVANRFLCHMEPKAAEKCLRNIAGLVKPGGYIFVSGVDLDVRTRVARAMDWKPVTDLIREVHEGDSSLRNGWPVEYWGLEPFYDDRADWQFRYASVFQIGASLAVGSPRTPVAARFPS
jgi:chemotaxis methyl-accepting protein methylase